MTEVDIYILGIESSCDETAASVVKNGNEVLSNIISSQIDIHEKYGGVVPEIASRNHIHNISRVVDSALEKARLKIGDIDALALTYGPGLVGALLVGLSYGKALSFAADKPFVGVNHIEGHIFACFIEHKELKPPFISLVASGGHTHLVLVKDYNSFEVLGRTVDDAAGESFDKVARALGLGYPGGPKLEKLALSGNENAVKFPRALINDDSYDFSFSGLKSAVLNYLNRAEMAGDIINKADVAASFQQAVVEVLVQKAVSACKENNINHLTVTGGVACNKHLRDEMAKACSYGNIKFYAPSPVFCTDNAAMIALRGYYMYISGQKSDLSLNAYPGLRIENRD